MITTQATLVSDVVAVYEKTIMKRLRSGTNSRRSARTGEFAKPSHERTFLRS